MNWGIFVLAVLWWLGENHYFGWNAVPQSDAELMADGLVYLLVALAVLGKR